MEKTTICAGDDFPLVAHRFASPGPPRAVVILPPAMGVRQEFYFPFARFLATRGFAVLSFDYRGIGASRPAAGLRGFRADLNDWASDYGAALRHARGWHPGLPLLVVGHSLGGQLPGIVADNRLIDGLLTVAAGSGYWRRNALPLRRYVWLLWYLFVPVATRLYGYFPGKRLKVVGDLPAGVVMQWARWCRSPHYIVDDAGLPVRSGYERMRVPLLCLSFTDDEMMSAHSIELLHACYRHAEVERRRISPAEVSARRIGHFGFFREEFRFTLWEQAGAWLERQAAQLQSESRRAAEPGAVFSHTFHTTQARGAWTKGPE